jgi:cyclophilin family peptidyl-prolyl cis-trans isomerase
MRILFCVLVIVAAAGVAGEVREAAPQSVGAKADQTAMFTCGTDQVLSDAILVTVPNTILAGDGRFFVPCVNTNHSTEHREWREVFLILQGLQSTDTEVRWRAAQVYARNSAVKELRQTIEAPLGSGVVRIRDVDGLGALVTEPAALGVCRAEVQLFDATTTPKRWQPGRLFFLLRDVPPTVARPAVGSTRTAIANNTQVQAEAAYGLGVRLSRSGVDADLMTAAMRELKACFDVVPSPSAKALILEDIGLARYERDDQVTEAESFLVLAGRSSEPLFVIGAARGLESLYRQHGQYPIRESALLLLRQLARYGRQATEDVDASSPVHSDAQVRRLALMALQTVRDRDTATLRAAALDGDWQVRRLVAGSLNLSDPEQARLGEILQQDGAFQVRHDLIASVSRLVRLTHECAPLVKYFKDGSPAVAMRAMDALAPLCTDLDEPVARLIDLADTLTKEGAEYDWHIVARALAALARVKPEAAQEPLAAAAKHKTWQLRATAAAASVDAKNEGIAVKLSRDAEPNVQTAALDALFRMHSTEVVPAAIRILQTREDYQVLRMAAIVLKGLPAEAREEASNALLVALRKLTEHESDTSRDPRIAILERLAETLDPGRSFMLLPFAVDFDDEVIAAVRKTLGALNSGVPGIPSLKRRYPYQPPPGVLAGLPKVAEIELDEGVVQLRLLSDVAPVTVARFAELASRGYYNGLTFHRVVPNFVVQGGSPGANEYMGTSRYMRDEVGPQGVHVRGAVGISTRGGDTGDGQIFIDLVDLPRLDRDYTVFAYVTHGMMLVDKLLEGATIKGVTVR